jgi:hypothetical protein
MSESDKLLERVISRARNYHDGHFFILSFTTGYKGGFGTPDLDTGEGREDLWRMPNYQSLEELLQAMLHELREGVGYEW